MCANYLFFQQQSMELIYDYNYLQKSSEIINVKPKGEGVSINLF